MKINETIDLVEKQIEQAAINLPDLKSSPGYILKLLEVATMLRGYKRCLDPNETDEDKKALLYPASSDPKFASEVADGVEKEE